MWLQVTLATKNDLEEPEYAQALKEMAAPGGFDITLDITEPGGYWDRWTEVDLGMTSWTHRPLDTMVLPLPTLPIARAPRLSGTKPAGLTKSLRRC